MFSHYKTTNTSYKLLIFKEKYHNHIKKPDADRLKKCH
ncbi:hypothetical protein STBHUCCB_12060 [Salmonella enterica subsp. enterica serovar Typhi str. P-stx-12]|nr:hypothetical protein STBHUCCB_12060 [Salmonella enterica subsp. enterica serovar Typhi str. P-stx-12]